jgi:molybdopterin synthase sulfur carrier subunit
MAIVWIPSLIRDVAGGQQRVEIQGETVGEIITALDKTYPGIEERLCEGERLRASIRIAVDGRIARLGLLEPVGKTSEVHFLPAISGG